MTFASYHDQALRQFEKQGWAVLRDVLPRDAVEEAVIDVIQPEIPREVLYGPHEQSVCIRNASHTQRGVLSVMPILCDFLDRLHEGRMYKMNGDVLESVHIRPPTRGHAWSCHRTIRSCCAWHIDKNAIDGKFNLSSVIILHFTDAEPRGGNTVVIERSHHAVRSLVPRLIPRRWLAGHWGNALVNLLCRGLVCYHGIADQEKFVEITANAGDAVVLHPLLAHTTNVNYGRKFRFTFRMTSCAVV